MASTYLLGIDIGSSSVKAALLNADTGKPVATTFSPEVEMGMKSPAPGFAEQDPEQWWQELLLAMAKLRKQTGFMPDEVIAVGISYQMHGLVCVDRDLNVLRPSIIWCDSRAVQIGNKAFRDLGEEKCLAELLNSPGNFTASKLAWVKQEEPELFDKIYKVMLPGDYVALRLTGLATTTVSGLSEGIFWNFRKNEISKDLLDYYGIRPELLSDIVPTFGEQGRVGAEAAQALGIRQGIPVSYRAGDQPNNAYSLNVLEPGEIAATAGTSGVVYGITEKVSYDDKSRVNAFVHVNHSKEAPRYGILLCINGTGSLNSWLRREVLGGMQYQEINKLAASVPIGSDGLRYYPFGNGAERILENRDPGALLQGLQFNRHGKSHMARAAQEGIVFALNYGMSVMTDLGMHLHTIRAGYANMFLSPVFAETFANTTGCQVELYNTDGAVGAARAAGVGAGYYSSFRESFAGMELVRRIEPENSRRQQSLAAYEQWKDHLTSLTV